MKKYKTNALVKTAVANITGASLISATASAVGSIPAGAAKTIAGLTTPMQSTALLAANFKMLKKRRRI